ncbi:EXTENDED SYNAPTOTAGMIN-RELATED [Salix purpurea]|uniref:EXTENDED SYNAPTOTAGMIN-RELATED n=1 Tax=Salix purpurea TaxID=77065 RepID=A0A9Q0ZAH0_SALPP|nr:EXTENDED SYNAPTOTAGMIN-RELATED [Salix purpurea]
MSFRVTVQLVDPQIFAAPRVALKPLVPTFPCFANIVVSLMERRATYQVASLCLWPQTLDIPVLDSSTVIIKKPVGILRVKVVRANELMKADLLGTSDPYLYKLQVFDWDKVGCHDRLGMQSVPLKVLTPRETKVFTLDLLKHTNIPDSRDKKQLGQIVVELTYVPFREDSIKFSGPLDGNGGSSPEEAPLSGAGLLSVRVHGAEDVEGRHHNNPYALLLFRGERKRTKQTIKKTRDPRWNEEFQFPLDQPPVHELIRIEVRSTRTSFSFRSKESLGHVEINLDDVVYNGRINQSYHLIDSRNGVVHVEIRWSTVSEIEDRKVNIIFIFYLF